jgi:hypothetical protein
MSALSTAWLSPPIAPIPLGEPGAGDGEDADPVPNDGGEIFTRERDYGEPV